MTTSEWISITSAAVTLLVGIIVALIARLWVQSVRTTSASIEYLTKRVDEINASNTKMYSDIAVLKKQSENHEHFTEQVLKPELDQVAEKVGEQAIEMAKMSRELVHINEKVDNLISRPLPRRS